MAARRRLACAPPERNFSAETAGQNAGQNSWCLVIWGLTILPDPLTTATWCRCTVLGMALSRAEAPNYPR